MFSQRSYNEGVVLIRCPGCDKLHLIADHLGFFEDKSVNIEELMRRNGETVQRVIDRNVFELTEEALKAYRPSDSSTRDK